MKAADFRRIALSLEGAEEGSHMGAADFRVAGRIFATLASEKQGYANLMLTPEQQADLVRELPDVFLPIPGGWGRMGMTHVRQAKASEDVLTGALRMACRLRVEKEHEAEKEACSAPRVSPNPFGFGNWRKIAISLKIPPSTSATIQGIDSPSLEIHRQLVAANGRTPERTPTLRSVLLRGTFTPDYFRPHC
jgi:hypothetical protein